MAELNYLDAATCQRWIDSHKKTYAVFHTWVEEQAHLATCRGWARNRQGRIRWVNEDNAKAQGASPARSAVNHCLDEATEVLTKEGWKPGMQLKVGDYILTKNKDTNALEWQPVTHLYIDHNYAGELIEYRSKSFNALSTPDHRWLVYSSDVHKDITVTSQTLKTTGSHRIHLTGDYRPQLPHLEFSDDEVAFTGWFLTDGYFCSDGRYGISQSKQEGKDYLTNLIERLPDHNLKVSDRGNCRYWSGRKRDPLGLKLRELFPDRTLTMEFLLKLDSSQLHLLLKCMIMGDGNIYKQKEHHTGTISFCASSKERADMFQLLATLCGYASTVQEYDRRGKTATLPNGQVVTTRNIYWIVTLRARKFAQVVRSQVKTHQVSNTTVWCPTVANSYFVARREDKVFITGNCVQSLASDISKLALIKTLQAIEGTACKLIAMVHDEIIVVVPGECKLNLNKSKFDKKGYFIPKYDPAEESIHWAKVVQKCMEDAESEIFNFELPGKADFAIAPYWNH